MRTILVTACLLLAAVLPAGAQVEITIGYLAVAHERPPVLSTLARPPEGLGDDGAALGIADNATTGRFLGHGFALERRKVAEGEDALAAARALLETSPLLVVDAPAGVLLRIADLPEAQGALLFNAGAQDMSLRGEDCRANLLHTVPSLAMRTDALVQYLVFRRWARLALITGPHPQDDAYAAALKASLAKFGLPLLAEKLWSFDADLRRAAAQEVPLFTQDLADHDLLLLADETGDFGRYIAYNTWLPRPVGGGFGLQSDSWSPQVEQWGAEQLQRRFEKAAGRTMTAADYAAWAAIRAIGEAVTRSGTGAPDALRAFMLSPQFELAGFKGRPMTFRSWNGQLRQPIALFHADAVVALAPLEGFLHQSNELDSLGLDAPDSACTAFKDIPG